MQIKRFEARDMTEALRLIKREFGSEAVILSARTIRREKGIIGALKKSGVEVTAATDTYYPGVGKAYHSDRTKTHNSEPARSGNSFQSGMQASRDGHNSMAKRNHFPRDDVKALFTFYQKMISQGVEEDIASRVISEIYKAASSSGFLKNGEFKPFLTPVLKEMGIKTGRIKINRRKQKIAAFVGSTGVGKTTTIAKLAAGAQSLRRMNRLALITLDSYRIAGITQLKAYAQIMGIPIKVASNNKELKKSIAKLKGNHLILIDTAGIPQSNGKQINELKSLFDGVHPVEFHLHLSAGTKEEDLTDILKRFRVIPINSLIFTKLDESTTYGNILNLLLRSKIPVSYFTDGQKIPEDIEVATLEKLAELIIGHEKEIKLWSDLEEVSTENSMNFERILETVSGEQRAKTLQFAKVRHA